MQDFEKVLRDLGLEMEVVIAAERSAVVGQTIETLERRGKGLFFVVQINRRDGENITRPGAGTLIGAGDGLVVVGRTGGELNALITAPAPRVRAGRTIF
jgi:K+/H+ antiporter YhaU regulatory subunit KhtT